MSRSKKKQNKPALQLRKPGQINAREAFIAGEPIEEIIAAPEASRRPDALASGATKDPTIVELHATRKAAAPKATRRRTTIYFDDPIYKQLKVHCAMNDQEMSATVTQAVARFLEENA